MTSEALASKTRAILQILRRRVNDHVGDRINEYIAQGRWSIGLEVMIGALLSYQVPVLEKERDELISLSALIMLPQSIAQLTVVTPDELASWKTAHVALPGPPMSDGEVARRANRIPAIFRNRVSEEAMQSIDEDIWAGEWSLGLDQLVGNLVQDRVPVTRDEYDELVGISNAMEYPEQLEHLLVVDPHDSASIDS